MISKIKSFAPILLLVGARLPITRLGEYDLIGMSMIDTMLYLINSDTRDFITH